MTTTSTTQPPLRDWELSERDGRIDRFIGYHLGFGTSAHHSKNRWFEVDLYRQVDGVYVIHTRGESSVEGETTRSRIVRTSSAYEVIELLTVYHNNKVFLTRPSSRALSQAAKWDEDICDAYIHRAVK